MKPILYKSYVIEPTSGKGYQFWKQDQGIDMDNVYYADSVEDAKDSISEEIMTDSEYHFVETKTGITKFLWIEDAVKFASRFNGSLLRVENI